MATDNKYDRQLRLWGGHGQKALNETRILLLGAGATGTETLKNLVLPGIGHITVVDDRSVTDDECKDNFFVTRAHVGQPLAKATQELLTEMNPDVKGAFQVASPTAVARDPAALAGYTLVIATQFNEADALVLEASCRTANVPLVLARTYGLIGLVRICTQEHLVLESKPDNVRPDWRLAKPFKEMAAFAGEFDFSALDTHEHGHVPYPVLLLHLIKQWQDEGHDVPSSYTEKKAFKRFISSKAPTDYLNYKEAEEFAYFAYTPTEIPQEVAEVLQAARERTLAADSDKFWFVARAVAEFADNEGGGNLPLCAELADVTSTTEWYMRLQRIYSNKAAADCAVVKERVRALEAAAGVEASSVDDAYIELFCKNARFVRAYKYRSLAEEVTADTAQKGDLASEMWEHGEMNPLKWYLMVRAADRFHAKHGSFPGMADERLEADVEELSAIATALAEELELEEGTLTVNHAKEAARYAACEPHNIAAIVGGVASQEVVKLVTHQYTPLNNTYVYNGISSHGAQIEL